MAAFGHAGRWAAPIIICAAPALAEPAPSIAPAPAWVRDSAIPPLGSAAGERALSVLLSSAQQRIGRGGSETYARTVTVPLTTAGLQALGNITIPWNSERTDLTIHHVAIRRAGTVIDLLKGQDLIVLRRENNLESSTLDGVRTVVLQAPGLQVGDIIDLATTVRERPGTIGAKAEAVFAVAEPMPIGLLERRILIEDGVKVDVKSDPGLGPLRKTTVGNRIDLSFSRANYVPAKLPDNAPLRYYAPVVQATAYGGWDEVVAVMRPLFVVARTPTPGSALLKEAEAIAAAHASPEKRMLAALRLIQEKVRYVALTLGEASHIPASAEQTWTRKFGDCKGKVAALLAILDSLGIAAEPMLTNSAASELLAERLPSLYAFDHVVVRAQIAGRDYILDPTNYGQRTLEELAAPGIRWGLPLVAGAKLVALGNAPPTRPLSETQIEWDARQGFDLQVPYTATLTYRGGVASDLRAIQAAAPDRAALEDYLKKSVPKIDNEYLSIVALEPEGKEGEFTVRFAGKSPMDWDRSDRRRFWFDNAVPSWKVDFKRKSGAHKDLPVRLVFPVWTRSTESIILPLGGAGFGLTGDPITLSVAGTEIKRSMTLVGGRATVIADFRRTASEITAEQARAAGPALEKSNENYAAIDAPKDYVLSRTEVKALIAQPAEDYDASVERARLLMDQADRRHAISELDKAIKLAPTRAEAPALQAINHFYMDRHAAARAALALAVANDAGAKDTLRARAMIAWANGDTSLALKSIDRAIELEPDYAALYSIRSYFHAGMGRYDAALADAREAARQTGDESFMAVARIEAASGKLAEALATLAKAAQASAADSADLEVMRGNYLVQLGRDAEARAAYRVAHEKNGAALRKHLASAAGATGTLDSRATLESLIDTRNYPEAEVLIEQIMARQRHPSAWHFAQRSWVRLLTGKYAAAIHDARAALDLEPSNEQAKVSLALAYVRAGRLYVAARQAGQALQSHEHHPALHYARGAARAGLKDQAGAAEDFATARRLRFDIDLDPTFRGLKPRS